MVASARVGVILENELTSPYLMVGMRWDLDTSDCNDWNALDRVRLDP